MATTPAPFLMSTLRSRSGSRWETLITFAAPRKSTCAPFRSGRLDSRDECCCNARKTSPGRRSEVVSVVSPSRDGIRQPFRLRRVLRYAAAVASVGATLGLRAAISPWIQNRGTYLLFLVAIAVSAWNGGFGPAILTTALSLVLAQWFLVPPGKSFAFETAVDVFLAACFLATAGIISMIVLLLTRDRARLRREAEDRRRAEAEVLRLNQELEKRVRERTRDLEGALLELEAFSHTVA